jgi:hypothetical protein
MRRAFVLAVAMVIAGSSNVLACPMCFGAEESSLAEGSKLLILVLLGVTLVVQGGFVGFFLYLRRRARRIADIDLEDEWLQLQRGTRTS